MNDNSVQPRKPPDDDKTRSEQARQAMEEYVADLRQMLNKFRKLFS
jgi:hypothetical protein